MAKITQSRKRKPICDGEIFSIGANIFVNNAWKNFTIGFKSKDCDDDGKYIYTDLLIDRKEAERIVKDLTEYLNGKS